MRPPLKSKCCLMNEVCSLQGYLAHKTPPPPKDPTVGPCLGSYGGSRGGAVSYERGTPVALRPFTVPYLVQIGITPYSTEVPRS